MIAGHTAIDVMIPRSITLVRLILRQSTAAIFFYTLTLCMRWLSKLLSLGHYHHAAIYVFRDVLCQRTNGQFAFSIRPSYNLGSGGVCGSTMWSRGVPATSYLLGMQSVPNLYSLQYHTIPPLSVTHMHGSSELIPNPQPHKLQYLTFTETDFFKLSGTLLVPRLWRRNRSVVTHGSRCTYRKSMQECYTVTIPPPYKFEFPQSLETFVRYYTNYRTNFTSGLTYFSYLYHPISLVNTYFTMSDK